MDTIDRRKILSYHPILRRITALLIAVAIMLSIFLAAFYLFQDAMIGSLSQMNSDFVHQVDTISGTLLDLIDNTAMQMFYARSVKTLRTGSSLTNAQRTSGMRELGNLVSSIDFLSSAMVYNANMDHIFTSEGYHASSTSEGFYDKSAVELLKSSAVRGSGAPIKRQVAGNDCYSFIFSEPGLTNSGFLLLNVHSSWYETQLLGISSGDSCVILDEFGTLLVAGSESLAQQAEQILPQLLERVSTEEESGFVMAPNGKTGWMYCRLNSLGWHYLRFFDIETISPGMIQMRNSALAILFAICLFLAAGTGYALVVLYLPIQAVRTSLRRAGGTDEPMVQQVDRLLESQLEQQASEQISRLLAGQEDCGIPLPVTLILTSTQDSESLRDLIGKHSSSLVGKSDFGCAVLISYQKEQNISNLCLSIAYHLGCYCLYGHARNDFDQLPACHENLLELWQSKCLYPGQQVLSEGLINTNHPHRAFQPKDATPLLAALRSGQLEEARQCWRSIFDNIRYTRFNELRFAIRYIFKSLTTLQLELELEPTPLAEDLMDHIEDIAQLHEALDQAFILITTAEDNRRKNKLDQLALRVNHRICAGYADYALSAQHIADEMGMNHVYLGRLFREATNKSISETINETRIKKAKILLLSTKDSIDNISAQVGFNNSKYFYVVFRNLVGLTPKQFRNQSAE